jgi:catalase
MSEATALDFKQIVERAIGHFRNADAEYGTRVEAAVKDARSS